MKFSLAVVVILAVFEFARTKEKESKDVPAFVRSIKQLHRGPPEMKTTTRFSGLATKYITQKLDHFDENNQKTWQMRYIVDDEHFVEGGPMFIHLGGEWAISLIHVIYDGLFADMAQEHNGILFYTEHRYYGESQPTSDLSVDNLQYLHVKQALADLAHFIRTQRKTDSRLKNSKVIIAGGSYAGTMVVWFSKLYPELVNGGWASSAPILAKVDFKEFTEFVGKNIYEKTKQCYYRIKNGIAQLEALFEGNSAATAKAKLKLCDNFDHHNDLDLWTLFSTIFFSFAENDQCSYLMSFDDDLTAIASFVTNNLLDSDSCIDSTYRNSVNYFTDTNYTYEASREWFFQTCNEFGWFMSSASDDQPFGTKFPAALFTTMCGDVFGAKYTNETIYNLIDDTNSYFGGLNPQVENVYMTHGALDPWSTMGQGVSEGASVIPGASHCADKASISDFDSPEMRASKERLVELVRQWLA